MRDRTLIGPWIRRFLLEHLVSDRNLTRNTQASYRDTLLLLLPFVSQAQKKPTDRLMIDDLSPARLRSFLEYLEKERRCSGATRNLRLAAIHSLAKFIRFLTESGSCSKADRSTSTGPARFSPPKNACSARCSNAIPE